MARAMKWFQHLTSLIMEPEFYPYFKCLVVLYTHNVGVSAVNPCGEGPNTLNFTLKPVEIVIIPDSVCDINASGGTNINCGKL